MKEFTNTDKSEWGEGPWQDEPDKITWVDKATDLDCMIHRNRIGSLCGYVGVGRGHPDYGKHYDEVDVDVHGRLTYANTCQTGEGVTEEDGICHVPEPGRDHDIWWLGFDCAHGRDFSPAMVSDLRKHGIDHSPMTGIFRETYKDRAYVQVEVERLALQLVDRG